MTEGPPSSPSLHYDHAFDVAHVVKKTGAKLHGSLSTLNIGKGGGLEEDQMQLFEAGKEVRVGRFTVSVLKSKHTPPIVGVNNDLGEVIDKPLKQPGLPRLQGGGSFDILIRHGGNSMLVKPSDNFVEGTRQGARRRALSGHRGDGDVQEGLSGRGLRSDDRQGPAEAGHTGALGLVFRSALGQAAVPARRQCPRGV